MNTVVATMQGKNLQIKINGRFTFSLYKDFSATYKNLAAAPERIDIDLRATEYIDSAALGMLLSMRNYFGPEKPIQLQNANETVRKILDIARFDKKFTMS